MSEDAPNHTPENSPPEERPALYRGTQEVTVKGDYFKEKGKEYIRLTDGTKVLADEIDELGGVDIGPSAKPEDEPEVTADDEDDSALSPEQQQARKDIIDFLTPRIKDIQNRKENPRPGDEFMLAKLEAIVKLAHEGEFTKREKYSGINSKGEVQQGGNSVLKYFASALEFEKEGSKRFKQISDIIESLEIAGVDVSMIQKKQAEKNPDITLPKTNPDNKQSDKDQGKNKGDDTNTNKNKYLEEKWLDPRYIQELKDKFEQTYSFKLKEEQERRKRLRDDSPILPSFREGIKAQVIKNAIADRKDRAEWLAGEENFGSERQPGFSTIEKWEIKKPSNEIIREMMEKLDEPIELLNELAEKEEAATNKFKPGDIVKVMNFGKLEDGWTVKGYQGHSAGEVVLVTNGKTVQRIPEKMLQELQVQLHPVDFRVELEKLKPFFNKKVKVKIGDDVIEADFAGVSQKGEAYVDVDTGELRRNSKGEPLLDNKGNPFHLYDRFVVSDIDGLINWQSLKSNEEVAADQAAKNERINRDVPENERKFELGQEVKNAIGKVIDEGWIVEDFKNDGDKVVVMIEKNGARHEVEQELLLSNQKEDAAGQNNSDTEDKGEEIEDKKDDNSTNQNKNNESEPKQKPKYSDQEQKIVELEQKLEELKKVEIAESMWEKRSEQWKIFWKKFDEGETSREKRKNQQKKKVAQFAGVAATVGLFPATLWGGIIGVPTFMGNQKYHNALRIGHKRQIEKLERDIKEEKEELELRKKKDSDTNK
jgi:hypothetical protein